MEIRSKEIRKTYNTMEILYNNSVLNSEQRKEWLNNITSLIEQCNEGLKLIIQAQIEDDYLKNSNPNLYSWLCNLYSALKYTTILFGDILVMHKYYLLTSNEYEKRFFRGKTKIMLNEGFKKLYGFTNRKIKKKENTIWQNIGDLMKSITRSRLHDDYVSISKDFEKLSISFDWWKEERNIEVHLVPDKLLENRMEELNESKYMMECYELIILLNKVKNLLYDIHNVYYRYITCHIQK